jgi:hypothetical protein
MLHAMVRLIRLPGAGMHVLRAGVVMMQVMREVTPALHSFRVPACSGPAATGALGARHEQCAAMIAPERLGRPLKVASLPDCRVQAPHHSRMPGTAQQITLAAAAARTGS